MTLPNSRTGFLFRILTAAAFIAIGLLTYGSSLSNKFVLLDDTFLIYNNPIIEKITPTTLKQAFSTFDPELYIPLTFVSYQIDYLFGGIDPTVFHFTNLLLHALNALLVAWVIRLLLKNTWIAIACGLIFLIHPLHTEAVAWASARKDVLSSAFFFASLGTYLKYQGSRVRWQYLLSIALFFLGLLAKVTVLTLPAVLLLHHFAQRTLGKRAILESLPYFTLAIVFGIIALFGKREIVESLPLWSTILLSLKSIVFSLQKFLFPHPLSVLYPFDDAISLLSPTFFVPAILLILLCIAALWTLSHRRDIAFAWAFFIATLLPSFITFKKAGGIFLASDRYAYIPSLGPLLIFGIAVLWIMERATEARARRIWMCGATAMVVLLILLGARAHAQSQIWRDSETLFLHSLQYYPEAVFAHNNLGVYYAKQERWREAENAYRNALAVRPYSKAHVNLGNLYAKQRRHDDATEQFEKAVEADPRDPDAPFSLGVMLAELGQTEDAIEQFRVVLALEEEHVPAMQNLGALYVKEGRFEEAIPILERTVELNPYYVDAHFNLALAYEQVGNIDDAISSLGKALQTDHPEPDLLASALSILKRVLTNNPQHQSSLDLLQEMMEKGWVKSKSVVGS